jgi:uncharacterized protein (TIGR03083 family)
MGVSWDLEDKGSTMGKVDLWPTVHAERAALAADLDTIDDQQWAAQSLCPKWTVRDVLAHMTATAKITSPLFFAKMAGSAFSLKKLQEKDIATERGSSAAETLARFKAQVNSSKHPPGPGDSWLGEVIVHSEDIRRPLGISRQYPKDAVVEVADFYKGSNLVIGAKNRIAGLELRATDADWSQGEGPEVIGPILSLLLAMAGRQAAIGDLTGPGADVLRSRP